MKRIQLSAIFAALIIAFFLAPAAADMHVTWVRTGIVLETEGATVVTADGEPVAATEQRLDAKRRHLRFAWQPGRTYQLHVGDRVIPVTAPLKPEPYRIRTLELEGHLLLLENLQRPAAPTALALGSGGTPKLAVATDSGHIALFQPVSGEVLWETRIAEGYVKHMAFSPDQTRLYIGEQAADGFIYGYDLTTGPPSLRWRYRTADDIETSTPSNPDSVYAWISYPGPSAMQTLPDGDLLVASVHSWTEADTPLKRSQLYRFDGETGEVLWKWPRDAASDKILRWFDVDAAGETIALVSDVGHSLPADTASAAGAGDGRVTLLNAENGAERWNAAIEPLTPYYAQVTFWRGVSVSADGRFINVTTDDGRALIFGAESPEPVWTEHLTTPLEVSDIPIVATSGTISATDTAALFVTGDTYIPYHLQKGAQRPTLAHPNAMTLFAYSWEGEKVWQWKLETMPQGLRIDAGERYAVLSVSKRSQDPNESLHGISVFDLTASGGGLSKYLYTYRTEGQLLYDMLAISADGVLVILVEVPIVLPDETLRGRNRVHVLF